MSKSFLSSCMKLFVLFAVLFALSACSPEEYGVCSIPKTNTLATVCGFATPDEGASVEEVKKLEAQNSVATCAIDYVFDCDSLVCGVYRGSDPFCTHRCMPPQCSNKEDTSVLGCNCGDRCKEECPEEAECIEWLPGSAEFYCLPKNMRGSSANTTTEPTE